MAEAKFLLHVLSALHLLSLSHTVDKISDLCPSNARVNLTGKIPDFSGVIQASGYVFEPESRWFEDDMMFGCFCHSKPCLPLCCPLETFGVHGNCVADNKSTSSPFPSIITVNLTLDGVEVNAQNFNTVFSDPCGGEEADFLDPENRPEDAFHLMKNGSIYLPRSNSRMIDIGDYCLRRIDGSSDYGPKICAEKSPRAKLPIHIEIMIPIPFLLATLIVYTFLPKMKTVHGQTMRGYLCSLLAAYTAMLVAQTNTSLPDYLCIITAYVIQFAFYASFFWLNVMCFDIWWRFGRSKTLSINDKQSNRKRSIFYSVYGWGCPVLFTGFCGLMDYLRGLPEDMVRPKFPGEKICWFENENDLVRGLLFHGPFGVILLCNNLFFVLTALKLKRDAKDVAKHLEDADSRRHNDNKQWFHLCLKLFIAMGISVTLEIVSWAFHRPRYLELVTYVWRTLRGLMIFAIFICKKTVIREIFEYLGLRVPNFLSLYSNSDSHRDSRQASSDVEPPSST